MKRTLFAAACTLSLVAFGCDDKKENKAATPELDKAADKVSDKAVDSMQGVEKSVKGSADQMKTGVDKMSDQAVGAETLQNNLLDVMGKAKKAVQEKKWDDAAGFVQQAKDLKAKLPADAQVKIDEQLADIDKMIAAGKKMMPGM